MSPSDHHYDKNKLNFYFAIASLVLLFGLILLFAKDYVRKWKDYQNQFRTLEVEQARVQQDKLQEELKNNPEYQDLLAQIEKEQKEHTKQCEDLPQVKAELEELKADDKLITQNLQFARAELDAVKYSYEAAKTKSDKDVSDLEQQYLKLKKRVADLQLKSEASQKKIETRQARIEECRAGLKELQRKKRQIARQKQIIETKLKKIDPQAMSLTNQVANIIRDLPVIDLANPQNSIHQVVLKDIKEDVNFAQVPTVERCTTCHLGIADPDYKDAAQPFRTHPDLEMYVGKDSAHPIEEFGCTACHGGRPRGTDFTSAAHTPTTERQAKEWKEKYGWERLHLWENPMYARPYFEAGCFKCHSREGTVKGAETLNLGLQIIERAGCYNCHVIERYEEWPKVGPDLTKIASKMDKDWAWKWIDDPHAFRKDTWMPAFYHLSNNSDPESTKRGQQEIHAMVHYLFEKSEEFDTPAVPRKGDAGSGEQLVASLGCMACHQVEPAQSHEIVDRDLLRRQHGPNLISLGTKTSPEWIYQWLKDPARYHPETRMPDMRLTDQEAADIAAYLTTGKDDGFTAKDVPAKDEVMLNNIARDFLLKRNTHEQAEEQLSKMSMDEKLFFAGEKLIGHYGCYSCHNIDGFENIKPIGTELTAEGSKNIHKLDFGFVHIPHTKTAWFTAKMKAPRIFDKGKIKGPYEKLQMPSYHFTDKEAEALVTALLGFVDDHTVEEKKYPQPEEIWQGESMISQMNCKACHEIEGDGGTIAETVNDWLVNYKGYTQDEADKYTDSYSPPSLFGLGKKVKARWLFEFLHNPQPPVRPWVEVRMPTFGFTNSELNTFVKYFNKIHNAEFPFERPVDVSLTEEEYAAAEKMFSPEYFDCQKCHVVAGEIPSGSPETWAPDLSRAQEKLRPGWLIEWIKNPTEIMPGTKMPTFFDPASYEDSGPPDILGGDEDEQIRVLRNYLMTLSDKPTAKRSKSMSPSVDVEVQSVQQNQ